jgi:hypothetical protein
MISTILETMSLFFNFFEITSAIPLSPLSWIFYSRSTFRVM